MPNNGLNGDIVVNGEKYVVAVEMYQGAPLLRFRRMADIPLSRHGEGPLPFIYEHGFASGMGYMRGDPRNPVDTYAFTAGMDAHEPGLMRLAGRRVSLTPTVATENVKTDFFESATLEALPIPITVTDLEDGSGTTAAADIIMRKLTASGGIGAPAVVPIQHARLTELNSEAVSTSYATSSISPAANRLILVTVVNKNVSGTDASPSGVAGNSLTYTKVAEQALPQNRGRISVWRGLGSPSSGAITATFAANQNYCRISVSEFANVDTSGTNGSGAVVQSATDSDSGVTSLTVTLAAFGADENVTFGAFSRWSSGGTSAGTPGAGFSNISSLSGSATSTAALGTQWQSANDTAVDRSTSGPATWAGIAIEIKAASAEGTTLAVFQTESISPTGNNLVIAAVHGFRDAGASAVPTLTGNGITWTEITSQVFDTDHRLSLFRGMVASPTAGKVTITFAAAQDSARWSIMEFANVDTGGTHGSAAVVQSAAGTETGQTTFDAITLSAFGAAANATFGAYAINNTGGMTAGTGFTEIHDVAEGGGLMTQWRIDNDTTPTATSANSANWGGIAIEIKSAAPSGTYVTGSFTPTKERLILATIHNTKATPTTPTLNGFNLTWDQVDTETQGNERVTVFRAMAHSDLEAGVLTINFGGTAQDVVRWSVKEFDGVVTTGDEGEDAVVQTVSATASSAVSLAITLAALAESTNATYGAFASTSADLAPGAGYDQIHEVTASTDTLLTEWRDDGNVTVDATSAVAGGSVAVDGSSSYGDDAASATSHTLSHTNTAGNYLLVGVSVGDTVDRITGVTYGGVPMTRLAENLADGGNTPFMALYALSSPATGANNIVVSLSANRRCQLGATSFTGVGSVSAATEATGNDGTPTITVTTVSGDIVFASLGWNDDGITMAAGASETERFESTNAPSGVTNVAGYTETATGVSTVIAPTASGAVAWNLIAVALTAGAGAAWAGIGIEIQADSVPGGAAGDSFIIGLNKQTATVMSVSSNVISEAESKDFGSGAECGFGTSFKDVRYIPLGKSVNAQKLTELSSAGVGTWEDAGYTAVAFCTQQDGPTSKIAKGYAPSTLAAANLVDLSTDGVTYANAQWEIGDDSFDDEIIKMVDTGTSFYVAKERNLYRADPVRIADKITHETESDPDHGVGLTAAQGTDAVLYNHGTDKFFYDGASRPKSIGIDSNPFNRPIPNITHEPNRGEYLESYLHGEWMYDLYRVTEASTIKTYLIVSKYVEGRWINHSYDRFDGWARGLFLDSTFRLWVATEGTYVYYQFGADGSPDAGRDAIGYGAASTTYYWYGPEIDAGLEVTEKRLWQFFILTRNVDATCPVQLIVHRDEGEEENVGAAISSAGLVKRYWTNGTNDTATRFRLGLRIDTTSGYDNTTGDPQVHVIGVRVFSEPDVAGQYGITIDTGQPYSNTESGEPPPEAIVQRDALYALKYANAVAVVDPDDNSLTLRIVDVSDLRVSQVEGPNGERGIHYLIDMVADARTTP